MIYRVFFPAALLHQQAIARVLIYHFNAEEKQHLAESVNEDFEESISAETGTSVSNYLQRNWRHVSSFENMLLDHRKSTR